jgi:hypothetical protein
MGRRRPSGTRKAKSGPVSPAEEAGCTRCVAVVRLEALAVRLLVDGQVQHPDLDRVILGDAAGVRHHRVI